MQEVLEIVKLMIRWGDTCDTAINKIYSAYGNTMSMTHSLNAKKPYSLVWISWDEKRVESGHVEWVLQLRT